MGINDYMEIAFNRLMFQIQLIVKALIIDVP